MAKSKINQEILISKKSLNKEIEIFKKNKDLFKRVNFHKHSNCKMHVMLMMYKKNFDYPFHFSVDKPETFILIRGKFLIRVKEKKGIKEYLLDNKNLFSYKINRNIFHKIIPLSTISVALEVLEGPYKKNSVKKI